MAGPILEFYAALLKLRETADDQDRDIAIVAGVLGAVTLFLIVAVVVLAYFATQTMKQSKNIEVSRKVEGEMDARRFSAYTGEEVHRRMMAANPTGLRNPGLSDQSEHAFNNPAFADDHLGAPGLKHAKSFKRF